MVKWKKCFEVVKLQLPLVGTFCYFSFDFHFWVLFLGSLQMSHVCDLTYLTVMMMMTLIRSYQLVLERVSDCLSIIYFGALVFFAGFLQKDSESRADQKRNKTCDSRTSVD